MADVALREDIYGGGPNNNLLRYWLSIEISREMVYKFATFMISVSFKIAYFFAGRAEPVHPLHRPVLFVPSLARVNNRSSGSFIVRRSTSSVGDYAITVVEGRSLRSYKVTDLGLGQVCVRSFCGHLHFKFAIQGNF
jgi:hypothetical protein